MVLILHRDVFAPTVTMGKLYINSTFFCYTLEPAARAFGVKIDGQTAIPEGVYAFEVSHSPRFNRPLIMVYNQADKVTLQNGGISFRGIRLHGGNRVQDTNGCPLVAYNRSVVNESIWDSAEKDLTQKALDIGGKGVLVVTSAY